MYREPAVDDAPVRGHGDRRRDERAVPLPARAGTDGPAAWRSTFRPRWGWTPTTLAPRARSGKTGVAIDSVEDMRRLLDGIPLDRVSTSMTINATAPILLLLYELVAEEQGVASTEISGTVQNDILKEYAARGTYIYPPAPSMRLITDLFAYCGERVPALEHDLDQRLPHAGGRLDRRAGDRVHACRRHRLRAGGASTRGWRSTTFAPRLSFFFACHMNFFEEIAKFRAARRMWARIMRERFEAEDPRSWMLRFHTQTGGATLTAQQPEMNIVRTALEALAAVLGGTQSLHTNAFDEALALPDRAQRHDRAPHPAGDRVRVGRDRDRRPGRGLLLRGIAHRRARAARDRATSRRSTRWAAPSARSRPASTRTRSTRRRSASSRASSRASGSSWA